MANPWEKYQPEEEKPWEKHANAEAVPTLEQTNAANRARREAPGFAAESLAIEDENKRRMIAKLPAPLRALIGVGTAVADPITGLSQMTGIGSEEWRDQQERNVKAARGNTAGQVGALGGNVAMYAAPMTRLAKMPKAAQYAGSAGIGALAGALDPVSEGESRIQNVGAGAALGLAGQGAGDALAASGKAAAAKVSPELKSLFIAARDRGIHLTPAQLSDSKFIKFLRSQLAALPGSGAAGQEARQVTAFNQQVSKAVGESEPMSREVFDKALTRLGGEFDQFTNRPLPLTNGFMKNVLRVQDEAAALGDADSARNMKAIADRIFKQGSSGTLDGRSVQSIDSALSKIQSKGGERAAYASEMRDALHEHLEKNMPRADFDAWRKTRGEYRNAMQIMGLVAKDGEVAPGKLMGAVTANKAGKRSMARGRGGEMGQLAQIGQRMKGPATSGTGERVQAATVGAGLWANPVQTLAGLTAGRAARGITDSEYLAARLMNPGVKRQAIAPYVPGAGLGVMRYQGDDE